MAIVESVINERNDCMKILILGGTAFFGRRLVHFLIQDGHDITVATRGQTKDDFGERVKRYVLTSSMAVYGHKDDEMTEEDFRPEDYSYDLDAAEYRYDEGKRQAEAFFYQHAPFPVVAVRVAMVVSGDDDYTGRFDLYVNHVATGKSIGVFETEHPITYVTAWDVAGFLRFLGTRSDYKGPINAANAGYLSVQELSREIAKEFGTVPQFHVGDYGDDDIPLSPYAMFPWTWKISNAKAKSLGYEFPDIHESIPSMVKQSVERLELKEGK